MPKYKEEFIRQFVLPQLSASSMFSVDEKTANCISKTNSELMKSDFSEFAAVCAKADPTLVNEVAKTREVLRRLKGLISTSFDVQGAGSPARAGH